MFSARFLTAVVLACSLGAASAQTATQTVTQIVVGSTDHTTLESLVVSADLATTLGGTGPFTLFAPTDAAFTAVPASTLKSKLTSTGDRLTKNWKPLLADTLKYHVLPGTTMAADLPTAATQVDTLAGKTDARWKVSVKSAAPQVTGVNAAGAVTTAQGEATVVTKDLSATNGVVHTTDAVLLPPSTQRTVVDIASSTDFSTLTELLGLAGLVPTLQTDSVETAFTVFAPTNAAFAKVDAGTLNCLKNSGNKAVLANLLKYHVVDGTKMSTDLVVSTTAGIASLATGTNTFTYSAANTLTHSAGNAMITNADLLANNGVVHVIDSVMIPSDFSCVTPAGGTDSSASAGAPFFTLIAGLVASVFALAF